MKVVAPPQAKNRDLPIVVVEDEETVLSFVENSLKSSGYRKVYACSDQASALQRLEEVPDGPVALIIDVALRAENGVELATRLLNERPAARVLLISGFIDEMVLPPAATEEKRVAFLAKPFNFKQFSAQFESLLAH
jgi:DNA-binding NtrC family response regulator